MLKIWYAIFSTEKVYCLIEIVQGRTDEQNSPFALYLSITRGEERKNYYEQQLDHNK
jgi:hypothetical protein